jgi:hypothetical protein
MQVFILLRELDRVDLVAVLEEKQANLSRLCYSSFNSNLSSRAKRSLVVLRLVCESP